MWQCVKCDQDVEENFFVCWNCGTSRDGTEDPDFGKADDRPSAVHCAESIGDELAGRFTRLASGIVDGILFMCILGPVYFATGYWDKASAHIRTIW